MTAIIQKYQPDVLCVQEALRHQLDKLFESINQPHTDFVFKQSKVSSSPPPPRYEYYGEAREGKNRGEFSPIFWNANRVCCLDRGTFWLSETPDVPYSKGFDAACHRICSWVQLGLNPGSGFSPAESLSSSSLLSDEAIRKRSAAKFFVLCSHWDHVGRNAQINSVRIIREYIWKLTGGCKYPAILTGDFNVEENSRSIKSLTEFVPNNSSSNNNNNNNSATTASEATTSSSALPWANLEYCKKTAKTFVGPNVTFHGFDMLEAYTIDYVLTSSALASSSSSLSLKLKPITYGVLDCMNAQTGRKPSDHRPVVVDFDLSVE